MAEMSGGKVLLIAFHYPPEGGSSGVLRTLKFSKYLPEFGWQPSIITAPSSAYSSFDVKLLNQIPETAKVVRAYCFDAREKLSIRGRYPGFVAIPDPFLSWLPFAVVASLRTIYRQKCQVIYSTSPIPTAHLIAYMCRRLTDLPWIADFRDPWVEDPQYSGYTPFRTKLEQWMESKIVFGSTLLTVTTDLLKDEMMVKHPGLTPDKVKILPNGYDEADFERLPAPDTVSTNIMEIVHTGYVDPNYRNPAALIEAISLLIRSGEIDESRIRLSFIGGGDYLHSAAFTDQIKSFRLNRVVQVHERVSYEESLRRLFKASILLILQGGYDTRHLIPAKTFEYLRANRPLLALTDEGVTARLIREYEAGPVVGISRLSEIRNAIRTLYSRFEKGLLEVNIDRDRLRRNYDRRNLTQKLADILKRVVAISE